MGRNFAASSRRTPNPVWQAFRYLFFLSCLQLSLADGIYTLTDLGALPGHNRSEPAAINNAGHVLVNSFLTGSREYRAFIYRDGQKVPLGTMGFEGCIASDLNDSDQAAGYCFRSDPRNNELDIRHAFRYSGGVMSDIGTSSPSFLESAGIGINGQGHVVGWESDGTNDFSFLYTSGQLSYLGTADGAITNSAALAINNAGQIVVSQEGNGFLYQSGLLRDLNLPSPGDQHPLSINARGQVVGFYEADGILGLPGDPGDGDSFTVRKAFLYSGGVSTNLGDLGAQESIALAINSHGQAVGGSVLLPTNGPPGYRAVLYQDGKVLDLNKLIPTNSGWFLQQAIDINDFGQIACIGISNGVRAVLLTPPFLKLNPENSTNRLGQEYSLVCTAISNGVPVVGLTLEFAVISGPGTNNPAAKATKTTDQLGQATFKYTGENGLGVDVIQVRGTIGQLPVVTTGTVTWVSGLELNPRLIIGCPGDLKDLELFDFTSGKNIAADPSVTYEWIGQGRLKELLLNGLTKVAPQVKGKLATLAVDKGQLKLVSEGVNVIQARRTTTQGEIESNYALVISGKMELNTVTSLEIGPNSLVNTPGSVAADKLTALLGKELPFRVPMILFPQAETACGGILQKLGNYGLVEVRSVQFSLFGGLIKDVDLMKAVQPLVGLLGDVFTLGTFGEALSTRALKVGVAQFLDFEVSDEARDPKAENPFIEVTDDHSQFPYLKGLVTAKKSGVALVQATLDLEKYCMGKATDLMWVWVLPDLDQVDIRNEQGRVARDAQGKELPIDVFLHQTAQPRAVGVFKGFAEAAPITIEWDPIGAKESDVIAMAEKILPRSAQIRDRIGVPIDLHYPTASTFGTNGLYEAGETAVRFKVTYLPLRPAIRIDDLRLQTSLADLFNTWSLKPADTPKFLVDEDTGKLTGLEPGLAELHLDVCLLGLSKGNDDAPIRVVTGDASCVAAPPSANHVVGETTAVAVSVKVGDVVVSGAKVDFIVVSGPNALKSGTDFSPGAGFSYVGDGGPGTDFIEISGFAFGKIFNCNVTRTWAAAAVDCSLTPPEQSRPTNTAHTVTARVTANLVPLTSVEVKFVVAAGPNQGLTQNVATDASGQARFTYTGLGGVGVDDIQAIGLHGNTPFGCASKVTWTGTSTNKSDISVSQTAAPNPALVGQTITYTITVNNAGPNVARNVTVTDTLPSEFDFVSAAVSQGSFSGTRTINCALGDVGIGASATVTLVVRATKAGIFSNTAQVATHTTDPNPANNSATTVTRVDGPDVTLSISHTPPTLYPGQLMNYQLVVRNLGPGRASGVEVTDELPRGVRFVSITTSQGAASGSSTIRWSLGSLEQGASANATITIRPTLPGRIENSASVRSVEPDPALGNNSATDVITVRGGPTITRLAPNSAPALNDAIELIIEGSGFAPGAVLSFEPAAGIEVDPVTVDDFGFISPSEIHRWIFLNAAAAPGVRDVYITNPDGATGGGWPSVVFNVLAPNQAVPKPRSAVLWLPGDGNPNDIVGANNAVLLNGARVNGNGRVGNAFQFDGTDDAVIVPNAPAINFTGTSPMSVEAWVYRTSNTDHMSILSKRSNCNESNTQYELLWDIDEGLVFAGGGNRAVSDIELPRNTWTHVAGAFDGEALSIFVDGYWSGDALGTLGPAGDGPLRLGGSPSCGDTFGGMIDEVTIYNRALGEGEFQAIAAAGAVGKNKDPGLYPLGVTPTLNRENLELAWPTSAVEFLVEEKALLSSSEAWSPVADRPVLTWNRYTLPLKPTETVRFYRIRRRPQ